MVTSPEVTTPERTWVCHKIPVVDLPRVLVYFGGIPNYELKLGRPVGIQIPAIWTNRGGRRKTKRRTRKYKKSRRKNYR